MSKEDREMRLIEMSGALDCEEDLLEQEIQAMFGERRRGIAQRRKCIEDARMNLKADAWEVERRRLQRTSLSFPLLELLSHLDQHEGCLPPGGTSPGALDTLISLGFVQVCAKNDTLEYPVTPVGAAKLKGLLGPVETP